MASGTIWGNTRNNYQWYITWSSTTNVAGNYSTVTANMIVKKVGANGSSWKNYDHNANITINGTSKNANVRWDMRGSAVGTTKTLVSNTVTVYHNSDGNKSISISGAHDLSGLYEGYQSVSGSAKLDTIPRASSFSISNTRPQFGNAFTFNINRASSGFTHTIQYSFNSGGWTNIATGVGTSYSYTIPNDWMKWIPSKSYADVQYRVLTYNGSTHVGTSSGVWQTISVPDSQAPTLSTFNVSESGTGLGVYVQGKSKVNFSLGATFKYDTTANGWTLQMEGASYHYQNSTTGVIKGSGNITLTGLVSDKRGKLGRTTKTINVLPYSQPSASIRGFRCNADGVQDDTNGTYIKVTMNSSITSLSGKNTTGAWLQAWNGTAWINLKSYTKVLSNETFLIEDASLDKQYKYRLAVSDKWTTVTSGELVISTAYVTMDFKEGGKGIAIGKVSEKENTFECNMDFYLHRRQIKNHISTYISNGTDFNNITESGWYGNPSNSETANNLNMPERFAFILRVIRDVSNNVQQIYYRYSSDVMCIRYFSAWNSTWSKWYWYTHDGAGKTMSNNEAINSFTSGGNLSHILSLDVGNNLYIGCSGSQNNAGTILRGSPLRLYSHAGAVYLGSSGSTAVTSDNRFKHDIERLDERYEKFFELLIPASFIYNIGKRKHIGFSAQQVEEAMIKAGIDSMEFAGLVIDKDVDLGEDFEDDPNGRYHETMYSLRYEEFVAINTHMIQKQQKEIISLKNEVSELRKLEDRLKTLEEKLIIA